MPFAKRGKKNVVQYVIGGSIAAVAILAWMTIPLMQKSSLDTSVSYGRHFKGKTSNLRALGFGPEGQAPGSPLSGELIDNPATASGFVGSSLYQSQGGEMAAAGSEDSASASLKQAVSGSRATSPAHSASASTPKAKLTMLPPLSGGGAGSSAKGIKSNRFFGTGSQRPEFAPLEPLDKMGASDKSRGGALLASLQKSKDSSDEAASASGLQAASQGASSAFGASKFDGSELGGEMEELAGGAGLAMGEAAQDLKKSNPQNKHKIIAPEPPEPSMAEDNDEMFKQMLIQMIISNTLGPMFGAIGQMMAAQINPDAPGAKK